MKTLVVTKSRRFGRMSKGAKLMYTVEFGGMQLACADTKDEALETAWRNLADIVTVSMDRVRVAVATDGTVITAREYQKGCVEIMYHRPYAPSQRGYDT